MKQILSAASRASVFAAAAFVAGCAHHVSLAPTPAPAPAPSWTPSRPAAPAAVEPDEAFHGVRFGASRADVLRAYPSATCAAMQCTGTTQAFGLPASFLVFVTAEGTWAARLTMAESTAPGANFNHVNDGLSARYRHEEVVIEDHGNLYRWRPDAPRPRQIVLRRCGLDEKCHGLDHNVVELAFFEQEPPLTHPW